MFIDHLSDKKFVPELNASETSKTNPPPIGGAFITRLDKFLAQSFISLVVLV